MSDGKKKKFIILDQSLSDSAGHHLNYTTSIAKAAEAAGCDVSVGTNMLFNKKRTPTDCESIHWHPWFTVNWFDKPTPNSLFIPGFLRHGFSNLRIRFADSILSKVFALSIVGFFFAPRHSSGVILNSIYKALNSTKSQYVKELISGIGVAAGLRKQTLCKVYKLLSGLLKLIKLLICTVASIISAPFVFLFLAIVSFRSDFFTPHIGNFSFKDCFSKQLTSLLIMKQVSFEDDVFIHTIGVEQIDKLFDIITRMVASQRPTFHVVLRRDLFEQLSRPVYGRSLKKVLSNFDEADLFGGKIHFYVDTAELQNQYKTGAGIDTVLIPIPPIMSTALLGEGSATIDKKRRLNLVYLGSARTEKGFQNLQFAVRHIFMSPLRDRVRFTIQCDHYHAGAEPGIDETRRMLGEYPSDFVTLLKKPLTNGQYAELLDSSDIILMPYNQFDYRARSSGVLIEALSNGKPVVVPDRTTLSSMADTAGASIYDAPKDFSLAVERAVLDFDDLKSRAIAAVPRIKEYHTASNLFKTLRIHQGGIRSAYPRRAVVIVNEYIGHGSALDRMLETQIRYLRTRGYEVSLWVADIYRWLNELKTAEPLSENLRGLGADSIIFFEADIKPSGIRRMWKETRRDISVEGQIANMRFYKLRPEMHEWLNAGQLDLILCNYVYCSPLVELIKEELADQQKPFTVCETHDIQCFQKVHFQKINNVGDGSVNERDLEIELSHLTAFDGIMAVGKEDEKLLRRYLGQRVHVSPRGIVLPKLGKKAEAEPTTPISDTYSNSLTDLDTIDLLFVGSWHNPNVEGVTWFFNEVLKKHLPKYKLHLAGTVCHKLDYLVADDPQVVKLGFVEDLAKLYKRTKIVIAPLISGAGLSVKVLEAMAHGKAIVSTRIGIRNLEDCPIPSSDNAEDFAARVTDLLTKKSLRESLIAESRQWIEANHSFDAYAQLMDKVIETGSKQHNHQGMTKNSNANAAA